MLFNYNLVVPRSQLHTRCRGSDKAILTQANTPVGSKIVYDGERKTIREVTPELFRTFVKESPFSNKTWNTCAVVGNGGILTNSNCGNTIDSTQFVIRCNLPPLENEFKAHVGSKTNIVTANPTIFINNHVEPHRLPAPKKTEKRAPSVSSDSCNDCSHVEPDKLPPQKKTEEKAPSVSSDNCKGCSKVINKVLEHYSQTWTKQEENYLNFRSQLHTRCRGSDRAILTQANAPVGSKIVYDGEKKVREVTPELFRTFVKESPFSNKTWDTCAVVGNGGILTNSNCGNTIDSTQFVIRCNLPPLENEFKAHVGSKTDIVTANPSSYMKKFGGLQGQRRPFVDSLQKYGNSMMLLPAFSFAFSTPPCLRALYSVEDFEIPIQPVFLNPEYIQNLTDFWRSQGVREIRLSTGLVVTSLALEICTNVHLYGFWPFSHHPHGFQPLTHHYYDDRKANYFHSMPSEFKLLLQLHSQGVLRLHLGQCGEQ
uniref:Alpha-2,8-sialyltransferase 8E-like n=1 Tax=Sphaeramia orbicularis TaxID=375764 RepID=A0A673A2A4_9TELE